MPGYFPTSPRHIPGPNREHVLSGLRLGLNCEQIGKRMNPPISRQRVGQIRDMEIRRLLNIGHHYRDLQKEYHINDQTMLRIRKGMGYAQERYIQRRRKEMRNGKRDN